MTAQGETSDVGDGRPDSTGHRQPPGTPDDALTALRAASASTVRLWGIGIGVVTIFGILQVGSRLASGNLDIDGFFAALLLAFIVIGWLIVASRRRLGRASSLVPVLLERLEQRRVRMTPEVGEPLECSGVLSDRLASVGQSVWAWSTDVPAVGRRVAIVAPTSAGGWRVSWALPWHRAGERVAFWRQWS